jgi:hypothetical protein
VRMFEVPAVLARRRWRSVLILFHDLGIHGVERTGRV